MIPARTDTHPARGASLVTFLAGLWILVSPWVYGASGNASAANSWIVGGLMVIFSLTRRSRPEATILSWFNAILGVWTFASPWVFGYTGDPGRLINSLILGIIVFCAAVIGANCEKMSHDPNSTGSAS